jgi:geranylgeranyl pyrophosphate synthase
LLKAAVDERLTAVLSTVESPKLRASLMATFEGGKRIRPICTLLSCAAAGGREIDALNAAVAVELLHSASLIHDDIMDRSELRRGKPTLHSHYGLPTAILAGDLLIALAFKALHGDPRNQKGRILEEFANTFVQLCEGQSEDIGFTDIDPIDPAAHREMVRKKTAELLASALAIGALVATENVNTVGCLRNFGLHLGLAYQAQDDLLDEHGNVELTGKPKGVDRRNGRLTYLTMAYPKVDTLTVVRSAVEEETEKALRALEMLPPTNARASLAALAGMLTERQH